MSISFEGENAYAIFSNESGGHRWQRMPPNEKRGRVHTSTVTVAVLNPSDESSVQLRYEDVDIQATRGSGPGGQARNKLSTCIVATHKETGISVRIDGRSQYQNKSLALKVLATRVQELKKQQAENEREQERKKQVGSGMRGDKIRTYRSQDDQVVDHRTGQRWRLSDWIKGNW